MAEPEASPAAWARADPPTADEVAATAAAAAEVTRVNAANAAAKTKADADAAAGK